MTPHTRALMLAPLALVLACSRTPPSDARTASGYVEATDIRVSAKVAGRVTHVLVAEGQRVTAGKELLRLATTDTDLAVIRAQAERAQAVAQLKLLEAGARAEDILQAEAQQAAAEADRQAGAADLAAARTDEARFEQLLAARSGSQKQRDDAVTRRQLAEARLKAAGNRQQAAAALVVRLRAGARPEELEAARARVASVDAALATLENDRREAVIVAPSAGTITSRLVEPGELVTPRVPLIILIDLDRVWANVYVPEPLVPSLTINAKVAIRTDAGEQLTGTIAFVSPQAEFTPRNVQTANERAKLVYRVKVLVDNVKAVLKPGMAVTADFGGGAR